MNLAMSSLAMSHAHMQMSIPLVITSALVVVTALVYLRGWLSLRNAFPTLISGWRLAAFMSGLVLVWVAVASPLATLDHQSLTIHMIKHLLLMTVAAPLILAGAPCFPWCAGFRSSSLRTYPQFSPPARWLKHRLAPVVLAGWHCCRNRMASSRCV